MIVYVTQRVDTVEGYLERRDCLDQRWVDCLRSLAANACVLAVPNAPANLAQMLQQVPPAFVVLSGGNDLLQMPAHTALAPERDVVEAQLFAYARKQTLPLLAACRGFQHLNVLLGGGLAECSGHVRAEHVVKPPLPSTETGFRVNSYHHAGFRPDELGTGLTPRLMAPDGTVEAASLFGLPWLGVMWHPERDNPDHALQLDYLRRFFSL